MKKSMVVPVLAHVVKDGNLSAGVFRSYCRLLLVAWQWSFTRTESLGLETQLVPLLGVSRAQALVHLSALRAAGLISWYTNGNHQYIVHFNVPSDFVSAGIVESGKPDSDSGKPYLESGNPDFQTLEEEEVNQVSLLDSSSTTNRVESGKPDLAAALSATGRLFNGERVTGVFLDVDPAVGLAMIAEIYANRHKFNSPARVLYRALKSGQRPAPEFLEAPGRVLPDWFCEIAGIEKLAAAAAADDGGPLAEDEDDGLAEETQVPPAQAEEPAALPGEAVDVFRKVWSLVEGRANSTQWRDFRYGSAYPVAYDGGVLDVCVASPQAAEWASTRLMPTCKKALQSLGGGVVEAFRFVGGGVG